MPEGRKRRLAAIMFADIVGYTAMMQRNEQQGLATVHRFSEVIETQAKANQGEVLEFRGDGCLLVFESAVEAMHAAKAIQGELQQVPSVPLRIGIHIGDIVFTKGNIYGDGVNLASRVESMGVPGSILVTERVIHDIKSHPEFEMASLGRFQFKNVEKSMEVFALANEGFVVPKKAEVKGKLTPPKKNPLIRFLAPLVLVLIAVGWFFWHQNRQQLQLPTEIREARIAVLPFENKTNDEELEVLGDMTADWITRNLMNLEDIKIVQFESVENHLESLQEDPELFVRRTGTEKMIKGRFYQEGSELIFESQIVDPQTAEVIFALPPMRGGKENPSRIVSELSQRVAGYFVISESIFKRAYAPTLEAYAAVEEGNKYFGSDNEQARMHYQRAIALDSNFLLPRSLSFVSYLNQGQFATAESALQTIQLKHGYASKLEVLQMDFFQAILDSDLAKEYQLIQEILKIDPKHLVNNYQSGHTALRYNRPGKVIENFQELDPHAFQFKFPAEFWWFTTYAEALARLERYEEALAILNLVPREKNPYYDTRQLIYTLQNQPDSLEQLLGEMEANGLGEDQILQHMFKIAWDYGAMEDRTRQMAWGARMLNRIFGLPDSRQLNPKRLAEAYLITENHEKAIEAYEIYKRHHGETLYYLQDVGCMYAKLGNEAMAQAFIQKLQERDNPSARGSFTYGQALIYASLNQQEAAMRLLRQAFREGHGFGHWTYNYSYHLLPLHGYPPYEEFVRPKN